MYLPISLHISPLDGCVGEKDARVGGAAVDRRRDIPGPEGDGGKVGPQSLGRVSPAVELLALSQLPLVV